jgi:hypothetical protein
MQSPMNRTLHTNEVLARVKAEVEKINSDGTLPPGVKVVPYYDRGTLVSVTTHTVLHNLMFGCLLVFLVQWIFLGDLRSAIIVGTNIPFALFFSIIILLDVRHMLHLHGSAVRLGQHDIFDVLNPVALRHISGAAVVEEADPPDVHRLLPKIDRAAAHVAIGVADCGEHLR